MVGRLANFDMSLFLRTEMGSSGSAPQQRARESFLKLVALIGTGAPELHKEASELSESNLVITFSERLGRCVRKGVVRQDVVDGFYDRLSSGFDCFSVFLDSDDVRTDRVMKERFVIDFRNVCEVLRCFMEYMNPMMETLLRFTKFYLESGLLTAVNCLASCVKIEKKTEAPYYTCKCVTTYKLVERLSATEKRYVNVIAAPASSNMTSIPLMMLMRGFKEENKFPLLFCILRESWSVDEVSQIIHDSVDWDGGLDFHVLTKAAELSSTLENEDISAMDSPIAVVFTRLEMLHFLSICKDTADLCTKSRFIFNDFDDRTVLTDVLFMLLNKMVVRNSAHGSVMIPAQLLFVSSTVDPAIKGNLSARNYEEIRLLDERKFEVVMKNPKAKSSDDVMRKLIIQQIVDVLKNWGETRPATPIGSMLIFLPGDHLCWRLANKVGSMFQQRRGDMKRPIFCLSLKPGPNERPASFFAHIQQEIERIQTDRIDFAPGQKPIFLCVMVISRFSTERMIQIVSEPLPRYLLGKLARIVITSSDAKNLSIPDLTAVIDSGFHDVEYYDVNTGFSYVQEEPVPKSREEIRKSLVGKTSNGVCVQFDVEGIDRPDVDIPEVRRIDFTKPSFALRQYNLAFENLHNLPNQPSSQILEKSRSELERYLLTDSNGNITDFGKTALKYSFLSPLFAAATAKFVIQKGSDIQYAVLPFIVFYLIEHGYSMVIDPGNEAFRGVFDAKSDLVTLFRAVRSVLKDEIEPAEYCQQITNMGLRDVYVCELRESLIELLEGKCKLSQALETAVPKGANEYDAVSSVLKCAVEIDKAWFEKRTAEFTQITNAASEMGAILKYKCDGIVGGDEERILCISRRPGWQGLVAPRRCYILSVRTAQDYKEKKKTNHGFLLHQITGTDSLGVVSRELEPVYNSPFCIALIQTYLGEHLQKDFTGIQLGVRKNSANTFLIHLTNTDKATYMNYCPKTDQAEKLMDKALAVVRRLLPFTPKSVVFKSEMPLCFIELMAIGCRNYESRVYLPDDNAAPPPLAYNLNAKLIDELAKDENRSKLVTMSPEYRIALTGESFIYMFRQGRQVTADLEIPDTSPELKSVFGDWTSHLFLIVDRDAGELHGHTPIPWCADLPKRPVGVIDPGETIALSSSIFEAHGVAARTADVFVITLSGNSLGLDDGEIPPEMETDLGYHKENRVIERNYHDLIAYFSNRSLRHKILTEHIPIKQLGSRPTERRTAIKDTQAVLDQLHDQLAATFKLPKDKIMLQFLGDEVIICRIEGLPLEEIVHSRPDDVYDVTYHPCPADTKIQKLVSADMAPVVVHETCTGFTIMHTEQQRMSRDDLVRDVEEIQNRFGFAVTIPAGYEEEKVDSQLGKIFVEIAGPLLGVSFAQTVRSLIPTDRTFDPTNQMTMTRTMTQRNVERRLERVAKGARPRISPIDQAFCIPDDEVANIKQVLAMNEKNGTKSRWKFDDNTHILIVPCDEEEQARSTLAQMNVAHGQPCCSWWGDFCGTEDALNVPAPLYVFQRDGSVQVTTLCEECEIRWIRGHTDPFFNANTLLLCQSEMKQAWEWPKMIDTVPDDRPIPGVPEAWPAVPIGSLLWCCMSSRTLAPFVRAWTTSVMDMSIMKSPLFIHCPQHPMFLIRSPATKDVTVKCPHCDMIRCSTCQTWHLLSEPCAVQEKVKGAQYCPGCNILTFKSEGCNRITCTACRCSWCWVCRAKFNTANECYAHLNAVHGGYWGEVDV